MKLSAPGENGARYLFWRGITLAWAPCALLIAPVSFEIFRGLSNQKATGLGAVAGGLSEAFITFGIVAFVISQVLAIVCLMRSFAGASRAQKAVALLSAGFSLITLVAIGLFFWSIWFVIPSLQHR